MRHTTKLLVIVTVAAPVLGIRFAQNAPYRLLFGRLERIITMATRVAGGGYPMEIQVGSEDEVRTVFEQFQRAFVDVFAHVPDLQKEMQASEAPSERQ